ncbi:hypothetical protein ONZ45_g8095 [Pleurotus djamor]|nr:hypothetical protein ONZ45_g8095 [Pleurotus djamor]
MASVRTDAVDLEQYKAAVRQGSFEAIHSLAYAAPYFSIQDQLEVWDLFAEILSGGPPCIYVLLKCVLQTEAPIVRCAVATRILHSITITLSLFFESDKGEAAPLVDKLRLMWPNIWTWLHWGFFYHLHTSIPYATVALIHNYDTIHTPIRLAGLCQFAAHFFFSAGPDYTSVMFEPSFIHFVTGWWYYLANDPPANTCICGSLCDIISLFAQSKDAVQNTDMMVASLGSSANFAAGLLAYLRLPASKELDQIQRELLAQKAVSIVIEILEHAASSAQGLTLAYLIGYLNQSMLFVGQSQVSIISKSRIFVALVDTAARHFDEPSTSSLLVSYITDFFQIFGQFCLHRSTMKKLIQSMDILEQEKGEVHFESPEIERAWSLFKECLEGGRLAKELRDSSLRMCASVGVPYNFDYGFELTQLFLLKDFETINLRARALIARCLPTLALYYQKYVVDTKRNDALPLLCTVDMTCFPQMISLRPDMSDAAYAATGQVIPMRLSEFHPCILVFAVLPPANRLCLLLIHGTLQPSPSFTSYQEFLDMSPDPESAKAQLQLDISSASPPSDVSFQWVTGGEWDVENIWI